VKLIKKFVHKLFPKKIREKISKTKAKNDFLNSDLSSIPYLEIGLYNKLKNLNYTVKEILESEENELLRMLQRQRHVKNLYYSLQEEIEKRELNIDLSKYKAFKNFKTDKDDKKENM